LTWGHKLGRIPNPVALQEDRISAPHGRSRLHPNSSDEVARFLTVS
jgi:hypothetical protein